MTKKNQGDAGRYAPESAGIRRRLYRWAACVSAVVVLMMNAEAQQQALTVLGPNGGEEFTIGELIEITWDAGADAGVTSVVIEISIDSGNTYHVLSTGSVEINEPEWGNYSWTIPDSLRGASLVSSSCLIRISDYLWKPTQDISDNFFTIRAQQPLPPEDDDCGGSGCGSGAASALFVPFVFRISRRFRGR